MKKIIVLAFCMIFVATAAHAFLTEYTGSDAAVTTVGTNSLAARTAFDAAANPTAVITFEAMSLGYFGSTATTVAPGVTAAYGNTTYIDPTLSGVLNTTSAVLGFNTTSGGSKFLGFSPIFDPAGNPFLTFTYSSPINAWGAYFTGLEPNISGLVHVTFNDGTSQDIIIPDGSIGGGVEFWGFVSSGTPISTITLMETNVSGSRDIWGIDDIVYARVPEPITLLLLGIGLIGVAGARRLKK